MENKFYKFYPNIIIFLNLLIISIFVLFYIDVLNSFKTISKQLDELEESIEKYSNDIHNSLNDIQNQLDGIENSLNDLIVLTEEIKAENYKRSELKDVLMLSEDEIELLARLVKCEAGNEPFETKVLVCVVVFNRMYDSNFKNTLSDVIYSSGQFEPVEKGYIETTTPSVDCYFAVQSALTLTYNEINELYGTDLMFFRAATEEKTFGVNTTYAFTVGKTDFYRLTK